MKLKNFLWSSICSMLLFLSVSIPIYAAEDNEINYKDYFDVEQVQFTETKESNVIFVKDLDGMPLFFAEKVEEIVYTTVSLNIRELPTINSIPIDVVPVNNEICRVGKSSAGWDIVKYDGQYCFAWNKYLSTEIPVKVNEEDSSSLTSAEYEAKEWIAYRESGGDYNAVSPSGKYIGRYQLTNTYLNGDYSIENQERVADNYVAEVYGSWVAAKTFWETNGWY